jgi:hypothetical protein
VPKTATFQGAITNYLWFVVEMRYKNPYGGTAWFSIQVDQKQGDRWVRAFHNFDHFSVTEEPADRFSWHSNSSQYGLFVTNETSEDVQLTFRITVSTWIGGALPSSGQGSLGRWGPTESREFTAIFKPPAHLMVEKFRRFITEGTPKVPLRPYKQ